MRISVIIPSYNEERAITQCIDSLYAQGRRPDEVLVVDDSTDSTPGKVLALAKRKEYKGLRLVRGQRKGVSAARNLGAKEANADIIVFMDADKRLSPDAIAEISKLFANPKAELARFQSTKPEPKTFIEKCYYVRLLQQERGADGRSDLLLVPEVYRRETFLRIGLFDESLRYFEDVDIAERVKKLGIPLHQLQAKFYHDEPATMGEFQKQARWLGSSINARTARWKVRQLFYPLGPVFWLAFILSALLPLFYAPAIWAFYAITAILIVEFIRCVWLSRMILPSIGWVFLSFARQFIIAWAVLKRLASRATKR